MLNLETIHKPKRIGDALELLGQPGTVALAGGTALIAAGRRDVHAVVDLGNLGLAYIRESGGAVVIGATTRLAELVDSPLLRALATGIVAQGAHRSAASVMRNQATAAGTLIAEPDGVLAVVLLALDAHVTLVRPQPQIVPLGDFLLARHSLLDRALLTEIAVPLGNPRASLQTVARTPSDRPIVSVCATGEILRSAQNDSMASRVRIALGGVAETALRAREAEQTIEGQALNDALVADAAAKAAQGLSPRGDFRGSVEYRTEMAVVLTRRAVEDLELTQAGS